MNGRFGAATAVVVIAAWAPPAFAQVNSDIVVGLWDCSAPVTYDKFNARIAVNRDGHMVFISQKVRLNAGAGPQPFRRFHSDGGWSYDGVALRYTERKAQVCTNSGCAFVQPQGATFYITGMTFSSGHDTTCNKIAGPRFAAPAPAPRRPNPPLSQPSPPNVFSLAPSYYPFIPDTSSPLDVLPPLPPSGYAATPALPALSFPAQPPPAFLSEPLMYPFPPPTSPSPETTGGWLDLQRNLLQHSIDACDPILRSSPNSVAAAQCSANAAEARSKLEQLGQ